MHKWRWIARDFWRMSAQWPEQLLPGNIFESTPTGAPSTFASGLNDIRSTDRQLLRGRFYGPIHGPTPVPR